MFWHARYDCTRRWWHTMDGSLRTERKVGRNDRALVFLMEKHSSGHNQIWQQTPCNPNRSSLATCPHQLRSRICRMKGSSTRSRNCCRLLGGNYPAHVTTKWPVFSTTWRFWWTYMKWELFNSLEYTHNLSDGSWLADCKIDPHSFIQATQPLNSSQKSRQYDPQVRGTTPASQHFFDPVRGVHNLSTRHCLWTCVQSRQALLFFLLLFLLLHSATLAPPHGLMILMPSLAPVALFNRWLLASGHLCIVMLRFSCGWWFLLPWELSVPSAWHSSTLPTSKAMRYCTMNSGTNQMCFIVQDFVELVRSQAAALEHNLFFNSFALQRESLDTADFRPRSRPWKNSSLWAAKQSFSSEKNSSRTWPARSPDQPQLWSLGLCFWRRFHFMVFPACPSKQTCLHTSNWAVVESQAKARLILQLNTSGSILKAGNWQLLN